MWFNWLMRTVAAYVQAHSAELTKVAVVVRTQSGREFNPFSVEIQAHADHHHLILCENEEADESEEVKFTVQLKGLGSSVWMPVPADPHHDTLEGAQKRMAKCHENWGGAVDGLRIVRVVSEQVEVHRG